MARFISERDTRFFYNINNEFLNDVVETEIQIFKVVISDSNPGDIYGESTTEKYYTGVRINCLINRSDLAAPDTDFGPGISQDIIFAINREMAKQKNIYPEIGDLVEWNSYFYEVNKVNENQRIAGRSGDDYNWSHVLDAHLTSAGNINIVERNQ